MIMPKVTIITTAYNAIDYVRDSLDSILEQTYKDFEIILLDDGSTDGTVLVLDEYANKFPQTKFLLNETNKGIPYSRNKALLEATGEYIAIHDADDVSMPTRLQTEVDFLDINDKIVFVGALAHRMSQTGEIIGSLKYPPRDTGGAFAVITRYKLNPIIDPTCMYRRDVILKHGGYTMDPQLRTVLDFELWCRLLCHGYAMANIQDYLIKYRINPNGVTRTENQTMVEATDLVWAKFRRKNFTDPYLDNELFEHGKLGDLFLPG
jgi:glycosyltransferase EpsE